MYFSNWNVNDENLKPLPRFFHLEKSSIFIRRINASSVSSRISDFLRQASIAAVFHDRIALVEATTKDGVQFTIRMFRGRGSYGNGIVLEVKRTSGSSLLFQEYCQFILNVAAGEEYLSCLDDRYYYRDNDDSSKRCRLKPLPVVRREVEHVTRQAIPGALFSAFEMLRSPHLNTVKLGLERLCYLTDVNEVNFEDAKLVSEAVVFSRNETFDIIEKMNLYDYYETCAEFDYPLWYEANQQEVLGQLALTILGNALSIISKFPRQTDDNIRSLEDYPWLGESLITTLMYMLKNAESWPKNASLSARCLASLGCFSKEAVCVAQEHNVIQLLVRAIRIGSSENMSLGAEAKRALVCLSDVC